MTPRTEVAPPEEKLVQRNRSCNSMLLTEVYLQSEKKITRTAFAKETIHAVMTCGHHYREPNVQLYRRAVHWSEKWSSFDLLIVEKEPVIMFNRHRRGKTWCKELKQPCWWRIPWNVLVLVVHFIWIHSVWWDWAWVNLFFFLTLLLLTLWSLWKKAGVLFEMASVGAEEFTNTCMLQWLAAMCSRSEL